MTPSRETRRWCMSDPGDVLPEPRRKEDEPARASVVTIALAFNKVAFESFGGGLGAWSRQMIVSEKKWLSEEEYLAATTICGILPGANQINMAVFVGTRLRGAIGAAAAVFGLIAMPALAALAVGSLYLRFKQVPALQHGLSGMSAAAAGLTLSVAWRQGSKTLTSVVPMLLGAATFSLSVVVRTPLWLIVAILGPAGFLWAWRRHGPG